jgi:hypothetical protein
MKVSSVELTFRGLQLACRMDGENETSDRDSSRAMTPLAPSIVYFALYTPLYQNLRTPNAVLISEKHEQVASAIFKKLKRCIVAAMSYIKSEPR